MPLMSRILDDDFNSIMVLNKLSNVSTFKCLICYRFCILFIFFIFFLLILFFIFANLLILTYDYLYDVTLTYDFTLIIFYIDV